MLVVVADSKADDHFVQKRWFGQLEILPGEVGTDVKHQFPGAGAEFGFFSIG